MPKKVLLCQHYDAQVIYPENGRCPMCESLRVRSALIRRLEAAGVLPSLPSDHMWVVTEGYFRALGPDYGHCASSCDHPPIPDIPLEPSCPP